MRRNAIALRLIVAAGLLLPASALARSQAQQAERSKHPRPSLESPPADTQSARTGSRSDLDPRHVRREAKRSQRRFESLRRRFYRWGTSRPGDCDERIGRICLWHDDYEGEIPAEPLQVAEARRRLIADLQHAAAALPEDHWIVGQLVRYLAEERRHEQAFQAAQRCQPTNHWWCSALTGYALHLAGRYPAAEKAFAAALTAMDAAERCRWRDISLLIQGKLAREYGKLACDARESIERRFWWLSDPLYIYPGNDRFTEHLARQVQARMQDDAATPFGMPWGRDLREVVLRYGWPTHFEKALPSGTRTMARLSTISHHHPDGRTFIPPSQVGLDPSGVGAQDWPLLPRKPRSEYAPSYAVFDSTTEHQLALFRRGDSAIVVAAVNIEPEGSLKRTPVKAALVVARPESALSASTLTWTTAGKAVLDVKVPAESALISVETLSLEGRKAGRARYGIQPPTAPRVVLALSDILILDAADSLPATLEEALPHARGSLRLRSGEPIALYWELYGVLPGGETLDMSLTVSQERGGFFKKIGDFLGVTSENRPLSLTWEEKVERQFPATPRALAVELPEMSPGRYELRLQVAAHGRETVVVSRQVMVADL